MLIKTNKNAILLLRNHQTSRLSYPIRFQAIIVAVVDIIMPCENDHSRSPAWENKRYCNTIIMRADQNGERSRKNSAHRRVTDAAATAAPGTNIRLQIRYRWVSLLPKARDSIHFHDSDEGIFRILIWRPDRNYLSSLCTVFCSSILIFFRISAIAYRRFVRRRLGFNVGVSFRLTDSLPLFFCISWMHK